METMNYEEIISLLPQTVREDIASVKMFIKTLKNIKLKQKIINSDNEYPYQIAFTSDYGFTYAVSVKKDIGEVKNRIYLIAYNSHAQQRKFGVRKKNYIVEALEKIAEDSPGLADELFRKIKVCGGGSCYYPSGCLHGVVVSYKDKITRTCASGFEFGSMPEDFAGIKILLKAMDDVYGVPSERHFKPLKIIYKLPFEAEQWKSECKDGLCDHAAPGAFAAIEAGANSLTVRPSAAAPNDRPYASCLPENIILDIDDTSLFFDFTSETKWYINLTLSAGDEKHIINFQSAIGSAPVGYDGCAGRHRGCVQLIDLLPGKGSNLKLERIDISSTWWTNASKLTIDEFIFGAK